MQPKGGVEHNLCAKSQHRGHKTNEENNKNSWPITTVGEAIVDLDIFRHTEIGYSGTGLGVLSLQPQVCEDFRIILV